MNAVRRRCHTTMPLSPVASRENLRKRGNSKPNAVVADNLRLVGEPGVSHRPLTLLEARDLALRQPPSVNRSDFRPSTLKKNRQFLKKYSDVNGRESVDESGLGVLLEALLIQQGHVLGLGEQTMYHGRQRLPRLRPRLAFAELEPHRARRHLVRPPPLSAPRQPGAPEERQDARV